MHAGHESQPKKRNVRDTTAARSMMVLYKGSLQRGVKTVVTSFLIPNK